jgi:hypothetical protein
LSGIALLMIFISNNLGMKKIVISPLFFLPFFLSAQNVGIGTNTPNSNAILHLESSNKGLLLPNIGSIDRTGMPSPPSGLLLYDFNTKSLWMRGATDWQEIQTFSNSQWTESNGNVYRLSGRVGIGISNPLARLHVKDSSVIFTAPTVNSEPIGFAVPVSGAGTRMMWLPEKSAFRAGTVTGTGWDASNIGTWSFAIGADTKASGLYSTAMGFGTTASNNYSIAMGNITMSSGNNSTSMGWNTTASGSISTTMGSETTASGSISTAMGINTIASGNYSTSMGNLTMALGNNSTAMGSVTNALGLSSTAMGSNTKAVGDYTTAMGKNTLASGSSSIAMGYQTASKAYASFAIGQYNDSIASSNRFSWVPTDPLFYIGNGSSDAARHNSMVVYKNGNMVLKNPTEVTTDPVGFTVPVSGAGTRLMWLPEKSAFRVGTVFGSYWDTDSIGVWSFASGYDTKAKGALSTAMGVATSAGYAATAMGNSTKAMGAYSTAMGSFTTALGQNSIAMGNSTFSNGLYSTAMGDGTTANGIRSTAMGFGTNAFGGISVSMGEATISRSYASLAIGRFNDSISTSNPNSWNSTDPLFYIGNGSDNNDRHNAMVVYKNGNMVLKNPNLVLAHPVGFTVPVSGTGTMMMWLPEKSAFRVGTAFSNNWGTDSIGTWSFAAGRNPKAKATYSTAIGNFTQALGTFSTAIGNASIALGFSSMALGSEVIAYGTYATATGDSSIASGEASFSSGKQTVASGVASFSSGKQTVASGNWSTAMGEFTQATGQDATALGEATIAMSYGSTSLGTYNDQIISSSQNAWVLTDPVFIVGNGTGPLTRKNAMVVYKNGNADLNGSVNVNYLSNINNAQLNLIENNGAEFTHLAFFNKNGVNNLTDKWLMRAYPLGSNASRRINFYTNGGANGGDILTIFGNGNATLAGILTQLSDARLKKNILPLQNVLSQLNTINAYHYQWSEEGRDSTWQIGVLAQEVQQVFPELVMKDEKGNLSVNYSGLIPVLLASVKEQQAQIEQLKKQQEEIIRLLKQK